MAIENDQFYTNPKISDKLTKKIYSTLMEFAFNPSTIYWIEPSAGTGNFIHSLNKIDNTITNILGMDIDPKKNSIKKCDFLEYKPDASISKNNTIVFGNPPFGKRGKLAIDFINKATSFSFMIGMILPKQFKRYLTQKNITDNWGIAYEVNLPEESFIANDKPYNVNCIFQIWVDKNVINHFKDLRKHKQLKQAHKDFDSYIHNNTKETEKYFNKSHYNWDIAIHRQGFYDYNDFIYDETLLKNNRQYIFIKGIAKDSLKIIKSIDYNKLSRSNTQTPGFSKTDLIKAYIQAKRKYTRRKNEIDKSADKYKKQNKGR